MDNSYLALDIDILIVLGFTITTDDDIFLFDGIVLDIVFGIGIKDIRRLAGSIDAIIKDIIASLVFIEFFFGDSSFDIAEKVSEISVLDEGLSRGRDDLIGIGDGIGDSRILLGDLHDGGIESLVWVGRSNDVGSFIEVGITT
jgi:hypothetical protein